MNTFIPAYYQEAQQQFMMQYSPQYNSNIHKNYFSAIKSQRKAFPNYQQQLRKQTSRGQLEMQTAEVHQFAPGEGSNGLVERPNLQESKSSLSFQSRTNRKVFQKQAYYQQKQPEVHQGAQISEQQSAKENNVKNRCQEQGLKDKSNSGYLQIPKSAGSQNESRKSSFDYASDVSTQLGESETPETTTVEKNSNSKRNQRGKQLREKKFEFDESYEVATVKRPKKQFKNEYERDTFIKNYQMKYKTEMCKNWELWGKCKFEKTCSFAHGEHELQKKTHLPSNYKTKLCQQFHSTSYCPYGNRCQFLHSQFDIYSKKELSYQSILVESARLTQERTISLLEGGESQYLNVFQTKRLPIFKNLEQVPQNKGKQ